MKRRTFIGSLLAGLGAICFPWRKRKREKSLEEIKQEILTEYFRSPEGRGSSLSGWLSRYECDATTQRSAARLSW